MGIMLRPISSVIPGRTYIWEMKPPSIPDDHTYVPAARPASDINIYYSCPCENSVSGSPRGTNSTHVPAARLIMMAMHVARMARADLHIHIGYVPASLLVWGEQ